VAICATRSAFHDQLSLSFRRLQAVCSQVEQRKHKTSISGGIVKVYSGESSLSLDSKGRLNMPSRYRDALMEQCGGKLVITRSHAGCVVVFPKPAWDDFAKRMQDWPISMEGWRRIYMGSAEPVEMDASGRFLITPELRAKTKLSGKVLMKGLGHFFEIWEPSLEGSAEEKLLSAGMSEDVAKEIKF
jgi:MraZ protein